ncbi:Co2+/Mg2+ efflux protein ApaG [Hyphobacterium indicum]|uniref:Co2+/Mg2+ efflux protein ApaG n=1 Tax=Hyphobacterium indicum TaxID=2162714 RepID=UPI000D655148|nr:Co2+/Mg2+ efflux protein ApaG [Hyphobacterium indicum]
MTRTHEISRYECETRGVVVRVEPEFLQAQSDPDAGRYLWSYTIEIENRGEETVQLISRHWLITDASGRVETVRGPGVVGEQPVLEPGQKFSYTSGAPLKTPSGFMRGSFGMACSGGGQFDAIVPAFSLDSPYERTVIH